MSFAVTCRVHRIAPVARSSATTASLDDVAGALYAFPVATYRERRAASTVGADQMPAPAGPHSGVPAVLVPRRCGDSAIMYVFHSTAPDSASSAEMLPRNVQQGYCGSAPCASSYEAT